MIPRNYFLILCPVGHKEELLAQPLRIYPIRDLLYTKPLSRALTDRGTLWTTPGYPKPPPTRAPKGIRPAREFAKLLRKDPARPSPTLGKTPDRRLAGSGSGIESNGANHRFFFLEILKIRLLQKGESDTEVCKVC